MRALLAAVLAWMGVVACAVPEPPAAPVDILGRPRIAVGTKGMAATGHPLASEAALRVLRAGGNAVDAAVAASFAAGVVLPYSTGLGGGGFMLVHLAATGETTAVDFRERAPAAATPDMFVRDGRAVDALSRSGHLAVAVPGMVAGLVDVHERFGVLPRAVVMEPAIELAERGFRVSRYFVRAVRSKAEFLRSQPLSRRLLFPGGRMIAEGDLFVQTELARTLRRVRDGGARAFYEGEVAEAIAAEMRRGGGIVTLGDLAAYRVVDREPCRGTYRGVEIVSMPPPSSGGVHVIEMLNVLETFEPALLGDVRVRTHLLAEVMRRAFCDRTYLLGDPDFADVPVERLISKAYAAELAREIDLQRATPSQTLREARESAREGDNTTHVSVIDAAGNTVASTHTINTNFGSGVCVPGTGVFLNNEMDDFVAQPGVPNYWGLLGNERNAIAPGKTPLSSMTPTIVFEQGVPVAALGSPGGSKIITAVLQVLVHRIDLGLGPLDAVHAPRIHHQWYPDEIRIEAALLTDPLRRALERAGHSIRVTEILDTDVEAVFRDRRTGVLTGVSDWRRTGGTRGF